jgi:transposase-like protein
MAKSVLNAPHFQDEKAAFAYVEAKLWPNGPVCPKCGESERVGRMNGKTTRLGLCKCYACQKPFTVRMGTIFESSHLPLHLWLQVIHLMCASKKGVSTRQVQRMLQCSMKTAWHLTHRIREIMKPQIEGMGGEGATIEMDTTFVGRKAGRKLGPARTPMNSVFALVERNGRARSFHVPNVRANTLHKAIDAAKVDRAASLNTDEATVFVDIIGKTFASHEAVVHSRDEYVRGTVHTNSVEGFFSILKRGVYGTFQHVSEHHLHRYLSEFDFRYSNREARGTDDTARAEIALTGAKGRRLTYQTTCARG